MRQTDAIILSCFGYELTSNEKKFFKNINPFGFILFKRNFKNKEQIKKLIQNLKKATLNSDLLIFIDQEGGRVQRLDNHEFIKFPPQMTFGNIYKKDNKKAIELAYKSSFLMGEQLKEICIDVNFSPVCDLYFDNAHKVIGDRSFGSDPEMVLRLSSRFVMGLQDSGIIAVPKHFPGHGSISEDSHIEKPIDQRTLNEIENKDLIPFKELMNNLDGIMTAHILFSEVDMRIATFSKVWIKQILKEQMKFEGMIFSDDLSMKGTNEFVSFYDKTKNAIDSGCEMILICNNREGVKDALKYFENNNLEASEKIFSMLMANDVSWTDLEKNKIRMEISTQLEKLI